MFRHFFVALAICFCLPGKSQCPLILNTLGVYTSSPQFINCNGSVYNLNFQSNSSFGTYTINWGDGGPVTSGSSYTANTIITHSYAATTNTYALTLTTGTCVISGIVVQEQASQAAIIPGNVGANLCAPKTLTFTNGTTFTSSTTSYTWSFGDNAGSSAVYSFTNAGQDVVFTYNKGSVNCATQVTLSAQNYCNFTPSKATFGPLQVYDTDIAAITADKQVKCWPDTAFTFTNTTARNCLPQGNTAQRYERWNFGNYWGMGHDSVLNWSPWPPTSPKTIAFPGVGPYSVSILDSNACGVSAFTLNLNIVPPPVASVIGPTAVVCVNTPVTFTNANIGVTQHRWNFGTGAGFTNLGSGPKTFTYTSPGSYTVKLVGFITGGGNACTDTAQTTLSVSGIPTASFQVTPNAGCDSLMATFTDASTGAAAWNWNFGNNGTSTLQAPPAQNFTTSGIHTVSLTVVNANNCTHTAVSTLTVRPRPVPSFVQFSVCEDAAVTFSNTSVISGSQAITGYTWNFGNGLPLSNATNPAVTYSAPGSYSVTLSAATPFCSDSVLLPVLVNVVPTASFVASPTVGCPPFQVSFSNLSQNAGSFFWKFTAAPADTLRATGATFSFTNTSQATLSHTVLLIAATAAGCSDSITTNILVRPKPVAGFTVNSAAGCSPKLSTFSNTTTGGLNHSWTFGDGGTSTATHPTHTYSNSSLFTQTLIAGLITTNGFNCSDTASYIITIYPEALPAFSMIPAMGCSPLVVNFPGVPGVAVYAWDHGDGSPTYTTLSSHTWTFVNTGQANKTFSIQLNAQTSNGCLGSGQGSLTVFNNPVADFTASTGAGCSPLFVSFSNQSTGHNTSSWDFGNGSVSATAHPAVTFTNAAGNDSVIYATRLVVTSADGCTDTITQTLTLLPQPRAVFTADTPACSPKLMKFVNKSEGAGGYTWTFGDGAVSTADSAQHLYVNATPFDKEFPVKLVAYNQHNCRDSADFPLIVHPKPVYNISAIPESGCSPLAVSFPSLVGVTDYSWSYDNNIHFSNSGNISNTFENKLAVVKTYTVRLVAANRYGCSDTASTLIRVYPLPDARFSAKPLTVYIPDQEVVFTNESSTFATSFSWDFGDGSRSEQKSPVHTYKQPGTYAVRLIAASNLGCLDTFLLPEPVVALEETTIQMPNAFTPNPAGSPGSIYDPNDTSNDIFHPRLRGAEKFTFSVYSRWGELLFETKNPQEGWDGYYKGKLCTQDVYIWKVNATFTDGKTYNKSGDVLLLR